MKKAVKKAIICVVVGSMLCACAQNSKKDESSTALSSEAKSLEASTKQSESEKSTEKTDDASKKAKVKMSCSLRRVSTEICRISSIAMM